LKDAEKTVLRLYKAIDEDERICIFSDYDADGIPAGVMLHDVFKKINFHNFENYIPHRNKEGFGLNHPAIDEIFKRGTKLLITLDCGIADVSEIDYATSLGMDVIVIDHHEVTHGLPKAYAIVNPKQEECAYPEKMLCGSGVLYKVIELFFNLRNFENVPVGWYKWLLDMVAIATLSDMVPLTGENRVLASYGLLVLRKSKRKGLLALLNKQKIKQATLTEDDVVFSITPRINAASRMGDPQVAFRLLASDDEKEIAELLNHLEEINNERKGHVAVIVKEVKNHVEKKDLNTLNAIFYGNSNWQPSLLGLAASSLVEDYGVPVFLWGRGDGVDFKGSYRSFGDRDVIGILSKYEGDLIESFGGHKQAGGFVLNLKGIEELESILNEKLMKPNTEESNNLVLVDAVLKTKEANFSLLREIESLAPYGMGNEKPVFLFEDVKMEKCERFGKNKEHLKIILNEEGFTIECIKFFGAGLIENKNLDLENRISLIGNIERNLFGGQNRPRIRIVDIW
jgi:single-stranded-DNA-specific exonuclease